jgi:ankyrin repeat protein
MADTLKLPTWALASDSAATGPDFTNPAIEAARKGDATAMQKAIDDKGPINAQDDNGMSALHHAAARGARGCIRVLVKSGQCDYLLQDAEGRYASDIAIEGARDYAVARLLIKKQVQQAHRTGQPAYVRRNKGQEDHREDRGR